MSLEVWNLLISGATFIVLAATAIAAVIQLRHIQGSNQVTALDEFRKALDSPQYQAGVVLSADVARRIDNPDVRRDLETDPLPEWLEPLLYHFRLFETLGTYVKHGILSDRIVFDLWRNLFVSNWQRLAPAIVIMRRTRGDVFMENFEMLTALAQRQGQVSKYPGNIARITPQDRWLSTDRNR